MVKRIDYNGIGELSISLEFKQKIEQAMDQFSVNYAELICYDNRFYLKLYRQFTYVKLLYWSVANQEFAEELFHG